MDCSMIIEAWNRKNLTQQELSELSGISLRTIQRLEKGMLFLDHIQLEK